MKNYIKQLSTDLFSSLHAGEELSLGLHSEESEFIRFNHSKVRQNTAVVQHELTLQFQFENKMYKATAMLTLNPGNDRKMLLDLLGRIREELSFIDENPKVTPMQNHGISEVLKKKNISFENLPTELKINNKK